MPNSVINVSRRMPLCEVRFDRTVKRHILNWMKKTSSRSHDKDEEQLTCLKTINYRTIFHTTLVIPLAQERSDFLTNPSTSHQLSIGWLPVSDRYLVGNCG